MFKTIKIGNTEFTLLYFFLEKLSMNLLVYIWYVTYKKKSGHLYVRNYQNRQHKIYITIFFLEKLSKNLLVYIWYVMYKK